MSAVSGAGRGHAQRGARPRVLLVDDEPLVLDALVRTLRLSFETETATSGAEALERLASSPAFAVIVSDMRMPGMTGADLLRRASSAAPETTRVLLTGQADLESAIAAINEGNVFRFLRKPCPPDELRRGLDAAVTQHRLVVGERELLEQTLRGSVQALMETLALACPPAFGAAMRVRRLVARMASHLRVRDAWQLEVAAMMFQLGTVTVPAPVIERARAGERLTPAEEAMVARVPEHAERVAGAIPRLESVAEILREQRALAEAGARRPASLAARALRGAIEFEALESRGLSVSEAMTELGARADALGSDVVAAVSAACGEDGESIARAVPIWSLKAGMVFADDVRTKVGVLLVARGHEVTPSLLARLRNHESELQGESTVRVWTTPDARPLAAAS